MTETVAAVGGCWKKRWLIFFSWIHAVQNYQIRNFLTSSLWQVCLKNWLVLKIFSNFTSKYESKINHTIFVSKNFNFMKNKIIIFVKLKFTLPKIWWEYHFFATDSMFLYFNNNAKIIRGPLNFGRNAKKPHRAVVFLSLMLRDNLLVSLLASKQRKGGWLQWCFWISASPIISCKGSLSFFFVP